MLAWIRPKLSFANTVSLIALFVALGGTGYAAISLPKNSVGAREIKKDGVSRSEVKRSAVATDEVKDNALAAIDVRDGTLTGAELQDGSLALADLGANSVDGSKVGDGSLAGTDVAPGTFLGGAVTAQFEQAPADLGDGAEMSLDVHCPDGQTALGGGARGDDTLSEETNVGSSRPVISTTNGSPPTDGGTFTGWRASVQNRAGGVAAGIRPEVWVICAALPTPAP